jgi:hypothetical protein
VKQLAKDLCIIIAASINYAGATLFIILWNVWKFHFELYYYLPVIFFLSLLIGMFFSDIEKAIICTYVSFIIGNALATALFLAPFIIVNDGERFEAALMVVLREIFFKVFLLSAIIHFTGTLTGCFLVEKISKED